MKEIDIYIMTTQSCYFVTWLHQGAELKVFFGVAKYKMWWLSVDKIAKQTISCWIFDILLLEFNWSHAIYAVYAKELSFLPVVFCLKWIMSMNWSQFVSQCCAIARVWSHIKISAAYYLFVCVCVRHSFKMNGFDFKLVMSWNFNDRVSVWQFKLCMTVQLSEQHKDVPLFQGKKIIKIKGSIFGIQITLFVLTNGLKWKINRSINKTTNNCK